MDKIETIREKIESLLNDWKYGSSIEAKYRCEVYRELLEDIDTLQEEHVSEDLDGAAVEAFKQIVDSDKNNFLEIFKAGAKWQKQQNQETIELAEDHAMLAGMEKMREQMMSSAVEGRLCSTICGSEQNIVVSAGYGEYGKDGDKVKVIILKDE